MPVPNCRVLCEDSEIIGTPFFVMDFVEGRLLKEVTLPGLNVQERSEIYSEMNRVLAVLHQVDIEDAGLSDYGKPGSYFERQVSRWGRQYRASEIDPIPAMDHLIEWLPQNMPPDDGKVSLIHGDYRIDNVILDKDNPCNILAVLDWEICALGDPLMDLGNSLAYWIQDDDPPELKHLVIQPSNAPGMLTRREILDLYQDRTGIDTSDFRFYQVYGYWRLAVILQQIYFRFFHGQTSDKRFKTFGIAAQNLGEHCQRLISAQALRG
jgi:aminoglycoside phosphotransferase (APT) family kinase protein